MLKLTAIIPTGNEEHNIVEAIQSVSFADEVMVVDSFSTDKTVELAKPLATKIIQREYQNSASQKNWAIPQAKHDWILLLDADERITAALEQEIKNILSNQPTESGFWIYRQNHFMGKKVRFSGWQDDKVIRLFKRDECRYEDKHVHAEITTQGKIGFLKNKMQHKNTELCICVMVDYMDCTYPEKFSSCIRETISSRTLDILVKKLDKMVFLCCSTT